MGEIEKRKKFKRKVEQNHPTNPKLKPNDTSEYDLDSRTIKKKQEKK